MQRYVHAKFACTRSCISVPMAWSWMDTCCLASTLMNASRSSRSGGVQGGRGAAGDGGGGGGAAAGARGPRQDRLHLALPHRHHLLAHEGTMLAFSHSPSSFYSALSAGLLPCQQEQYDQIVNAVPRSFFFVF